jgi:ketosteroid isomerase-like protein
VSKVDNRPRPPPAVGKAEAIESAVRAANQEFYRAFRERDLVAMDRCWAQRSPVACVHPGWQGLTTRQDIIESWLGILASPNSPHIFAEDENVLFFGEAAMVLCYEIIGDQALMANNVFVREDDRWQLVFHQATPLARSRDRRAAAGGGSPRSVH